MEGRRLLSTCAAHDCSTSSAMFEHCLLLLCLDIGIDCLLGCPGSFRNKSLYCCWLVEEGSNKRNLILELHIEWNYESQKWLIINSDEICNKLKYYIDINFINRFFMNKSDL